MKLHLAIQRSERRSSKPSALSATPLTKALVTSKVFLIFYFLLILYVFDLVAACLDLSDNSKFVTLAHVYWILVVWF